MTKKLKERFFKRYKFCNHDTNKFILFLRKGVCPYEYSNYWEKFNKASLPEKEDFYSLLNMEDFSDADYAYAKIVYKDFELKNLGQYHGLFVQSDMLLLADVFENFRKIFLEIYKLDPQKILSVPELAWKAASKKTKVKLDLSNDMDILLMVEKGIRGGIWCSVYRYAKANSKYVKHYDKNQESSYLQYWDANNLYGWAMSQKLPVNNFEWIRNTSQFNEDFGKL